MVTWSLRLEFARHVGFRDRCHMRSALYSAFGGVFLAMCAGAPLGFGCPRPPAKEPSRLLQRIQSVEGTQEIHCGSGYILITTPAISQLVAQGLCLLGDLVDLMEEPDTSFDAFARCFSACDQILS